MGITIPEFKERRRLREDDLEVEREDPTDPQGKRPIGTTRRKKKKSTGGGRSKNAARPLVDKNSLLVPMMEKGEEEKLREILQLSIIENTLYMSHSLRTKGCHYSKDSWKRRRSVKR